MEESIIGFFDESAPQTISNSVFCDLSDVNEKSS